jgi:CRISPR-associated protein Cas1
MTHDERKRFGINKSTLWYEKKQLAEGKTVKIYNKVLSKLV